MAKITHPEMKRGRDVQKFNQPSAETYVVDDKSNTKETTDTVLDERIAEFEGTPVEEKKSTGIEFPLPPKKPEPDVQKALEKLIFMGRHSKEIELVGHKFEISTLSHKENNDIVGELMNFGEAVDLFTIRVLTLAYALRKIDDVSLDETELVGDFKSDFHKRMTIIDNLQLSLVERLHTAYEKLVKEADEVVYGETIKN